MGGHQWLKNINWIDTDNWLTVKISTRLMVIRRKILLSQWYCKYN
jgi:hypothetical protein